MNPPYYKLETLKAGNSVGYLTKRCGLLVVQLAERAFEGQTISFTQWIVLARLRDFPHQTPTQLSHYLGHDMGALTRIVDDLQSKRLAIRERSEVDRRAVQIAITAEGRRVAKMLESLVVDHVNDLVGIYTKAEADLLISLLQRLLAHLERCVAVPAGNQNDRSSARHY